MTTDLIDSIYRRAWWALALRGLLGVAVGSVILWRPLESVAAFALSIALWAIFSGTVQMVHAFELRPIFDDWWVACVGGLVSVGFGVAALYFYPVLSLAFAVAWVAYWLLFTGALGIYAAVVERRIGVSWGWTMAFGILAAAGVPAILSPRQRWRASWRHRGFAIGRCPLLIGCLPLAGFKARWPRARVGTPLTEMRRAMAGLGITKPRA
jgi:uncharacterized membrane protein HdeD (DUF308 family)